jgi:hypothetical protein
MRNLTLYLIVGAAIGGLAIGGAAGWTINGWRLAGQIQELKGVVSTQQQGIDTLKGANERCTAAVGDVKGSVKALVDENAKRSAASQAAIEKAAKASVGHMRAAKDALNRIAPKPGEECATFAREAAEYVRRRKEAR